MNAPRIAYAAQPATGRACSKLDTGLQTIRQSDKIQIIFSTGRFYVKIVLQNGDFYIFTGHKAYRRTKNFSENFLADYLVYKINLFTFASKQEEQ